MPEPLPIEVHKALADDTRYRLYRYLRLSGRPVAIRELATRLSLHPNTLRPHLRRLEEVGLVATEQRRASGVGRPQTLYVAVDAEPREGRDHQLLADILAGLLTGPRQRERAQELAREWGA
ncbi:MAG TPA: helix-turn-helix domain-containing protein, partial [Actinomycetota bacterium]|nr:helix-turn-helix domain-containing protein [Actinomycetota bacterium]